MYSSPSSDSRGVRCSPHSHSCRAIFALVARLCMRILGNFVIGGGTTPTISSAQSTPKWSPTAPASTPHSSAVRFWWSPGSCRWSTARRSSSWGCCRPSSSLPTFAAFRMRRGCSSSSGLAGLCGRGSLDGDCSDVVSFSYRVASLLYLDRLLDCYCYEISRAWS